MHAAGIVDIKLMEGNSMRTSEELLAEGKDKKAKSN